MRHSATTASVRRHRCAWPVCAAAFGLLLAASSPALADGLRWHPGVDDALAAAAKSGKPVFAYIYNDHASTRQMRFGTLRHPMVMQHLASFECCPVDAAVPANAAFVDEFTIAMHDDPEHNPALVTTHASVFLDAARRSLYVQWGNIPVDEFIEILQRIPTVARLKADLEAAPDDPRLNADLGHVLAELGIFDKARELLQRAFDGDPENKVGAREDATLDLIILRIPDDPEASHDALAAFLADWPDTDRALEVRYYTATALVAQAVGLQVEADGMLARAETFRRWADDRTARGTQKDRAEAAQLRRDAAALERKAPPLQAQAPPIYRKALTILDTFKTADKTRPEHDSPWTPRALGLRSQVREAVGLPAGG